MLVANMSTWLKLQCRPRWARWIIYPTVTLAWINFVALFVGSMVLGGNALNGYSLGSHYFLCVYKDGPCTEVSQLVWRYSYLQTLATICLVLLTIGESVSFKVTRGQQ